MNCNDIETLAPLYLSGELDPAQAVAFAQHLKNCRACAAEIQWQRQLDTVLRAGILSEETDTLAIDQRVRHQITRKRRPWAIAAAGLAATLLLSLAGYYAGFIAPAPPLCVDAAHDHRNEVTGKQHRTWLTDPQAIAELAQRVGISGSLPAHIAPPDYRLKSGKLCRLDGSVYLHLVYAKGPVEFSTYLRPAGNQTQNQPIHETDTGHEHVAYFRTTRLTAVFVTDQSSSSAWDIARFAAQAL